VKTIVGFIKDESGNILFTLEDKNGNLSNHEYINIERKAVKIGSVRKITNAWEELSAGMKIQANTSGISMFPKKDVNIIIGFLYDTGGPEPLVLCSNLCTLWYSDVMENFDIIKMSDSNWKTLEHAPLNISRMRYQAGDILSGRGYYDSHFGYLAFRPRDSRTIRAAQLSYFGQSTDTYTFDRHFTRDITFDGFPNPRLTAKQEEALGFVHAMPNFHGMFTAINMYRGGYMFANEPRSILNVSDSSE
jgi:hypothetical protein